MGKKQRKVWVDVAKGIAMILVIAAHTADVGLAKWAIYSFHMPLFFLLSGTVSAPSRNLTQWRGRVKKLLHPLITCSVGGYTLLLLLLRLFGRPTKVADISQYLHNLLSFDNKAVGFVWFLMAMYLARILYDLSSLLCSHRKVLFWILLCLCNVAGVYIGVRFRLPFGLDIALAILILFALGKHIKEEHLRSPRWMLLFLLLWLGSLTVIFLLTGNRFGETPNYHYLSLVRRSYPLYPLCFLCAFAGTAVLCGVSVFLRRLPRLFSGFAFVGKHSLTLLMVHYFDRFWNTPWVCLKEAGIGTQALPCLTRIGINLAIFCLVMLLRSWVKKGLTSRLHCVTI